MRKGLTLIEALIVTVVIAVLAAMGYLGVDEYIASAKATKIIMNLHTLRKALWAWYVDNREKVQQDGRVKIGSSTQPIQQWQRNSDSLKLGSYLKRLGSSGLKFYQTSKDQTVTGRQTTDLVEGYYGVCDGGTSRDAKGNETASYRNDWYAGYRFKDDEDAVRTKIIGRLKSSGGLWLGTADAHETPKGDNSQAVWIKVR
ncbi:MAG: prepilin-type N-terminal cleavage/methylation domain-containing protein [Synergistaceae bacterium]|nr:prepilin-type N-terminal cleavage/methylation domain-containing protein [Synergistaceae bacterium]